MASTDPSKLESAKATSGTVAHTEYNGTGAYVPDVELVEAAVAADEEEARQGRKALFSMYGPAVLYSCLLSLALVMEGMDVGLINNFFAHPSYKRKFGWGEDKNGEPFIPADWQTGIGLGNNAGSIIGLLLNGYLQSRFGSRRVYMVSFTKSYPTGQHALTSCFQGAMALMACTIFVLFFATSVEILLVGNLLCGIPWVRYSQYTLCRPSG
jgi:MFS transporter, SP family, general alpha glucoside:H+ symporter